MNTCAVHVVSLSCGRFCEIAMCKQANICQYIWTCLTVSPNRGLSEAGNYALQSDDEHEI